MPKWSHTLGSLAVPGFHWSFLLLRRLLPLLWQERSRTGLLGFGLSLHQRDAETDLEFPALLFVLLHRGVQTLRCFPLPTYKFRRLSDLVLEVLHRATIAL